MVLDENNENKFSISEPDNFTKNYSVKINEKLSLMAVGSHSEDVLNDKTCSHGLGALLKTYLPLLSIKENEYIVVDEKAGVDSVGTGIPTGFSMAIIVAEATVHGIKAAKQISELLKYYNVPYCYVVNKVKKETDLEFIKLELNTNVISYIPFGEEIDDQHAEKILTHVREYIDKNGDLRYTQSVTKFKKNIK
jgi:CO dehydrogenase nickel-insertion accessory protein CooC1